MNIVKNLLPSFDIQVIQFDIRGCGTQQFVQGRMNDGSGTQRVVFSDFIRTATRQGVNVLFHFAILVDQRFVRGFRRDVTFELVNSFVLKANRTIEEQNWTDESTM